MEKKSERNDRPPNHPYLSGNFAPIQKCLPLTPCTHEGAIPKDLAGGQYVRNGGNPATNVDLGREAHWFDGDGMLSGVLFRRVEGRDGTEEVRAEFVNRYLDTDIHAYSSSNPSLRRPVLPSIATLVNPLSSTLAVVLDVLRAILFALLSRLPGSARTIRKISVANTSVLFHDGRALATCESGPPLRFALPGLETVGWYNGRRAENKIRDDYARQACDDDDDGAAIVRNESGFGGTGPLSWMREWTTAHPKVDPSSGEMISFHSTFVPPYVRYSIVPSRWQKVTGLGSGSVSDSEDSEKQLISKHADRQAMFNVPVPGIQKPKMMHDFGVSLDHTVIMDLPLTLDPLNLLRGRPSLTYQSTAASRFGVFPRYRPDLVQWVETSPCVIFHAANCWDARTSTRLAASFDESGATEEGAHSVVNLLVCRMTSPSLIFSTGNLPTASGPTQAVPPEYAEEEDQCRLYYYSFPSPQPPSSFSFSKTATTTTLDASPTVPSPGIWHQWALSVIPFEFPTISPLRDMQPARYVYGCSTTASTSYTPALGKAVKIDLLAKIDAQKLISRGLAHPPQQVKGSVDTRTVSEILAASSGSGSRYENMVGGTTLDANDPIQLFRMPEGWYAQEPRFVPRRRRRRRRQNSARADDRDATVYEEEAEKMENKGEVEEEEGEEEDDGWLATYVFDESQLDEEGNCPEDAFSELWIIDAKGMTDIAAKVKLPQRVPYGLHGGWFSEEMVESQRPYRGAEAASDFGRTAAVAATSAGLAARFRGVCEGWLQ